MAVSQVVIFFSWPLLFLFLLTRQTDFNFYGWLPFTFLKTKLKKVCTFSTQFSEKIAHLSFGNLRVSHLMSDSNNFIYFPFWVADLFWPWWKNLFGQICIWSLAHANFSTQTPQKHKIWRNRRRHFNLLVEMFCFFKKSFPNFGLLQKLCLLWTCLW